MKIALATAAGLAVSATASAQVLDISGILYDGAAPTPAGMVVTSGSVTNIEFNLGINAGNFGENISWGSEFTLQIDGPAGFQVFAGGGDFAGADITFGWADTGGTYTFAGTLPVSGGAGTYTVTIFDTFDDAGNDGVTLSGSTINFVPAPGAIALAGLGGIAASRRRR